MPMNWDTLEADEVLLLNKHYTPGRSQKIRQIVLHHNAGNLSIRGCYDVWQTREASAHYQVDINGRIGQLVNDWDTAWHAGNANPFTIGIEHANNNFGPWTISEATLDSGAHLVAALCKGYGLGVPTWGENVVGHSTYMSTSCPGEIGGSQNAEYMDRARKYYAEMTGGDYTPSESSPPPAPSKMPDVRYKVRSAGVWLPDMVNRYDTGGSSDTYAGNGNPIEYLAIDMPGWYQVRTVANGWLPKVYKYDPNDLENGCAGDGSAITAVRCYYETQNPDSTGWLAIRYAVANAGEAFLPEMKDLTDLGGSNDDYAGNGGTITAFYAYLDVS